MKRKATPVQNEETTILQAFITLFGAMEKEANRQVWEASLGLFTVGWREGQRALIKQQVNLAGSVGGEYAAFSQRGNAPDDWRGKG